MSLIKCFSKDCIICELESTTKTEAIEEMVTRLSETGRIKSGQVQGMCESLLRREIIGSTGIGRGVGVPHVKNAPVGECIGVFGRSKSGIDYRAIDGAPVHLVFMLVSPPEELDDYLEALKKISSLANDEDLRRFLRKARDCDEIVDILREADESISI